MRKVIVNTTPLIALSHVRQLDILRKMYGEILIPQAVYQELSEKQKSVCKKQVDNSLDWIHIEKIRNEMAKSMYKTQLHDGEVEVMMDNHIYISEKLMEFCIQQAGEEM